MTSEAYELDQLQKRAERIRFILDELDNVSYNTLTTVVEAQSLLTDYLEETEEEVPPWEQTFPQNDAQLELDLGDSYGQREA